MVIIILGVLLYRSQFSPNTPASTTDSSNTSDEEKIDLSPPSEENIEQAGRNKERLAEEMQTTEEQSDNGSLRSKQAVTPIIGYLRQSGTKDIEANGYVTGISEDTGTCTLELVKSGATVSESKQAMPDAQSTVCGLLTVNRSRLSSGEWKATINYTSAKYQGTSEEILVQVE